MDRLSSPKNSFQFLAWALLLGMSMPAFGQTACPQGVGAGSAQCGPSGGGDVGSTSNSGPSFAWRDKWGAFAQDTENALIGISTDKRSKRAAQKAAMKKCKEMGGKKCEPIFEYMNTCAVAAQPIEPEGSMALIVPVIQSASTIGEATELGLQECLRVNSGRTCEIKYSNCLEPDLVRN